MTRYVELTPGEDVVVTGEKLTATKINAAKTRIRVRDNRPVPAEVPPVEPPPPPAGAVAFGSRPVAARMDLTGKQDVVIEGKTFRGGTTGLAAIRIISSARITIRDCDFIDVPGGIYAYRSQDVTIEGCRYSNITGPHARTGANVGNFVQTNECDRVIVRKNKGKGGDTEDIVSIFATSHSIVEDNHFEGTNWTSPAGSGIALGDYGGVENIARRNVLVNPGQVGAFIAGGQRHTIEDNIIIKPKGSRGGSGDIGMYVALYGPGPTSGHTVQRNRVLWYTAAGTLNSWWTDGQSGPVAGWKTNKEDTTLDVEQYRVVL